MRKFLFTLLLVLPIGALADHVDVIEVTLKEGCSLAKYVAIKDDFNKDFGAKHGYRSEVLVPIQSHNLVSLYWIGRSKSAAAFGAAWDQWRNDLSKPDTAAAKLWARFVECSSNVSRRGYDVY